MVRLGGLKDEVQYSGEVCDLATSSGCQRGLRRIQRNGQRFDRTRPPLSGRDSVYIQLPIR